MESIINQSFSDDDRKLLASFVPFIDCLGTFLGEYCEIVLHSFEDLHHSVIHIVNGHVTGRERGAPVTNVALEKLAEFNSTNDMWDVYFSNKGARPFKSSSSLIVNKNKSPVGMICMNFALDMPLNAFIDNFAKSNNFRNENFTQDINNLVLSHLEPVKNMVYANTGIPSKNKNYEIIKELNAIGLFEFPVTNKIVSSSLGISPNTVYKHLRSLNSKV
ncbi:DNA-binding protein [Salmonella enterica subsp. enterica]|uniref:DNA-binding protein n=1 Tax=Salmonella enterica TaxID=28901 RepID=A0A5U4CZN9_SALER|nr:DNA-binding protein [Salmonella enterica subsp. enterica]EBP8539763.1 DNA-binding protein [Salmonella enterica]EBT4152063.1 DNA-binding protein [Salmonella enterica subsp. enterica]EED9463099.1 DNA-binding protein [Salmonella enterica subsp. enterica serovar Abaetetuba]